MDFSAYAYEKEVLLMDGQEFLVSRVETVWVNENQSYTLVQLEA